jgi:hypothetical protein
MFEIISRYNECGDASIGTPDNKTIKYKKRRFIPKERESQIVILEIDTVSGDRIDLISFKYLGDPEQFWKLCDMNGVMHPLALTNEFGKPIKIIGEK